MSQPPSLDLVRALLLDFSSGSPTAGASHDRLLEIAASPDPALWTLLVHLVSDAATDAVMLMSAHLLLYRLRRVRTLSPDERHALAASLPEIYTRSAPLAAAAAAGGRSPSPPLAAACTQLWARALVSGCAPVHVQAALVRAVQASRLHEVNLDGWQRGAAHGGFCASPATCVALLTACVELCTADTFATEREFLDMRSMLSALIADILPHINGWFACFLISQPAHVQLAHTVGLPLLQLLHAACAGADASLGTMRASGILASLCRAIAHLGAAFADLLGSVASSAHPPISAAHAPFLAAAPAPTRDIAAQILHVLLDTVSECVAVQAYPLHAEHNVRLWALFYSVDIVYQRIAYCTHFLVRDGPVS
jgi:hypothetical protein